MSLQQCRLTGTNGFPLRLQRNIFDPNWSGINESDRRKLISPIDFDIAFGPESSAMNINTAITTGPNKFEITIPDYYANNTTITYNKGSDLLRYTALQTLSITNIRHSSLVNNAYNATHELMWPFVIDRNSKQNNPSSPDIILLCRPLILSEGSNTGPSSDFWNAVNISASTTPQRQRATKVELSSVYTYGDSEKTLMPMMTYETCLNTTFLSNPNKTGRVIVRVHVITTPTSIYSQSSGTGQCSSSTDYIFPNSIKDKLISLISSTPAITDVQFTAGNQYKPPVMNEVISIWPRDKIEFLVPEALLGKSLADISKRMEVPVNRSNRNKQYKCYTIDPTKDIKNGQITVDPLTGENLESTMNTRANELTGGDAQLAAAIAVNAAANSGIMPGHVEYTIFVILTIAGTIFLCAELYYSISLIRTKNWEPLKTHGPLLVVSILFIAGIAAYTAKKGVPAKKI
jgi:hypothetical protein